MNKNIWLLICSFALFGYSGSSLAGTQSYQCLITEERFLDSDGTMKPYRTPLTIGKRFAINRSNGALVEPDGGHWFTSGAAVTVLAEGNKDNSFTAVYVAPSAGSGAHFTYISVEEYSEQVKKPFVVVSGLVTYSGLCD